MVIRLGEMLFAMVLVFSMQMLSVTSGNLPKSLHPEHKFSDTIRAVLELIMIKKQRPEHVSASLLDWAIRLSHPTGLFIRNPWLKWSISQKISGKKSAFT
jgi:hypothetical protein